MKHKNRCINGRLKLLHKLLARYPATSNLRKLVYKTLLKIKSHSKPVDDDPFGVGIPIPMQMDMGEPIPLEMNKGEPIVLGEKE